MPIPLLVAVVVAAVSAAAAAGGTAVYKNSKHNKERKRWQDEKHRLQAVIEDLQGRIVNKQEEIAALQHKLMQKEQQIHALTTKLHECDKMIDGLEERQSQLESRLRAIIAFITFRYPAFKVEKITNAGELANGRNNKEILANQIQTARDENDSLEWEKENVQNSLADIEQEKLEQQGHLENLG
jgi:chromosome segregation ATPase